MMSKAFASTVICCVVLGFGTAANAAYCEGKNILFEDKSENTGWLPPKGAERKDGKYRLTVKQKPGEGEFRNYTDWPENYFFSGRYNVCVKVKMPGLAELSGYGLSFWGNIRKSEGGHNNNFRAYIAPDGFFWVTRYFEGEFFPLVSPKKTEAIAVQPGAINELEVRINGRDALFIINGQEVAKFSGQAPSQSVAGITASAGAAAEGKEGKTLTVEFSEFMVKN